MRHTSEFGRGRETLRYEASSIEATIRYHQSQLLSSPPNTDFAADPVLTSLAQLAAVRFDAAGAFISFFDAHHQYMLAQATQLSSIIEARHEDDPGQCGLLGKSIPRPCGFCEDVLLEFGIDGTSLPDKGEGGRLLPVSVIPDITSCPLSSRPNGMPGLPNARFYAAVPVRSPSDVNIGVFVVYCSRPRTEVEPRLITFLRDMSVTVTGHLQMKQTRAALRRSERMVRGLGSFVEGAAGMSFNSTTSNIGSFQNEGFEGTLNPAQQEIQRLEREQESSLASFQPLFRDPQDQMHFALPPSPPSYFSRRPRIDSSSESQENQELASPPFSPLSDASIRNVEFSGSINGDEDEHISSTKSLFSRAANIIRESIEVEGVVFVDASLSTFGGLVGTGNHSNSASAHSSSEESLIDNLVDRRDDICDILGYSTTSSSSLDGSVATPYQAQVPEKFLKTLLRRHPQGKIYHFSEEGLVSTSGDSSGNEATISSLGFKFNAPSRGASSDKVGFAKWSRQNEGASLLKIFPNAKSIALIPLWDYKKERWYASGIVWTCTPARVFTKQGELSYLRAFGMSILSELARLEAQTYDKAKSDILGSLSHELRSPLHGVVAATDLLHDTSLDAFQCDVLHSLESCGRVLLDVLNHLLDYSKVNTFMQDDRAHKKARKSRIPASPGQRSLRRDRLRLSANTQLDSLLEESIDSVFAGHMFQKLSIAQFDHRPKLNVDALVLQRNDTIDAVESFGHQTGSSGKLNIQLGDVCVLVDIDPDVSWSFRAQPGALRRIILNIFGNSLRYTDRGFIVITLRQEKNLPRRTSHTGTNLKLTITDTGRGIGSHFMQHHLFTPFAQEDRLSPGTGLGLSLVKKIVKTLGGNMTIESQVGVGTRVQVAVPLSVATDEAQADANFEEHKTALSGLRVSLVGLSNKTHKTLKDEVLMSESELMHNVCSKWLKLQIVELNDGEFRPDLILCGELGMDEFLKDTGKAHRSAPIVVICKDAITSHQHNKSFGAMMEHRILEFISQPIGPRKLAKSLDIALSRWAEVIQAETLTVSEPETPCLEPSNIPFPGEPIIHESSLSESDGKVDDFVTKKTVFYTELAIEEPKAEEVPLFEERQHESAQHPPKANGPAHIMAKSEERFSNSQKVGLLPETIQGQEVLLVDDNNINLRILASYMKKLKKPYRTATNGLEAFKTYTASPSKYSCILMDLSMPVMGGLESSRKIREFERSQRLQSVTTIVALTGLASLDSQQEAFASGMNLYLTKPVRLKEVADVINRKRLR
ncbi:hsp90-like protein [Xylaria flabelliformis]|nr:hsp90-like protein [Xylaria flabelliformis]